MKNRYLPFGYEIADGKIVADSEQVEAVRRIFDAYTAGQAINGFAANAECGRNRHKPRKLSIALWKNCDGSGRTSNSSTRQRARRMCNQWELPCWIVKLGKH